MPRNDRSRSSGRTGARRACVTLGAGDVNRREGGDLPIVRNDASTSCPLEAQVAGSRGEAVDHPGNPGRHVPGFVDAQSVLDLVPRTQPVVEAGAFGLGFIDPQSMA